MEIVDLKRHVTDMEGRTVLDPQDASLKFTEEEKKNPDPLTLGKALCRTLGCNDNPDKTFECYGLGKRIVDAMKSGGNLKVDSSEIQLLRKLLPKMSYQIAGFLKDELEIVEGMSRTEKTGDVDPGQKGAAS